MSNLLSEYRRRHSSNFIWAMNDGICFFNKNRNPAAICIVSDPARSVAISEPDDPKVNPLVCEVFTCIPSYDMPYTLAFHKYITPDTDLYKLMIRQDKDYIPYLAKDQRDIEAWLWNFYLRSDPYKLSTKGVWRNFLKLDRKQQQSNINRAFSQMVWCVYNMPQVLIWYYERLYQHILIGRQYLLFR